MRSKLQCVEEWMENSHDRLVHFSAVHCVGSEAVIIDAQTHFTHLGNKPIVFSVWVLVTKICI